ncbi:MAG: 3-methyl-2-oxobutanoate hydroxymethyltransferase [Deltaproteobacteria bacterium]|nr:MAG: 3-methyl-2-oxobutanoate hydroxymethyltransferase [Deltaproteobacteria bacterium]
MANKSVLDLRKLKAGNDKIVMVTAYDYTMARLVDMAGVDMVLVGDSLGMVVQGRQDTLPVTLDEVIYHTKCVARGLEQAHLVFDMPFGTYQVSAEQALENAIRAIKESGAQSVKLEGGERVADAIRLMVAAGIPVVGHVGLTPQSVHAMGGFKVQGRTDEAAERVIRDALAVQDAGAFCLVLEGLPTDVAAEITARLEIPTIGIGAGPHCDGQVLVCTDLLGMNLGFKPKFVKHYARLQETILDAVGTYASEVRTGAFPDGDHSFTRKSPRKLAKLY